VPGGGEPGGGQPNPADSALGILLEATGGRPYPELGPRSAAEFAAPSTALPAAAAGW
jgi:hypothetical protein